MTFEYVIWSFEHKMWWRPDRLGYTPDLKEAGRYSAEDAGEIVTDSVMAEEVAILVQLAERMGPPKVRGLWG